MQTIISKTWSFRTVNIKTTCKCSECGKPITKSFSLEIREDIPTTKEDMEYLENKKTEWLKEPHICNNCKRKKILQERKDITETFRDVFTSINIIQQEIIDKKLEKKPLLEKIKEELKDKVIIYNEEEYVVNYIQDGYMNGCAFEIYCDKVNKTRPWELTSNGLVFYKRTYSPCNFSNFVEIENCIITDEIFSKRKELL